MSVLRRVLVASTKLVFVSPQSTPAPPAVLAVVMLMLLVLYSSRSVRCDAVEHGGVHCDQELANVNGDIQATV